MVCDEVTSGLDPRSEDQILAVLQRLRDEREKAFICIIHNLAKLEAFDWITVVFQGAVVFQGSLDELTAYFDIPDALHLYDRLNEHGLQHWREAGMSSRMHNWSLSRSRSRRRRARVQPIKYSPCLDGAVSYLPAIRATGC